MKRSIPRCVAAFVSLAFLLFSSLKIEDTLEIDYRSIVSLVFLFPVCAIAVIAGRSDLLSRFFLRRSGRASRRNITFLLFALSLAINSAVALIVFDGRPRLDDGTTYLFQARIFADGHLTLPVPQPVHFFTQFGMIASEKWFSQYPPGFPLALTPFVLLGVSWLANPLFGALTTVMVYRLGDMMLTATEAAVAAMCMLMSPFACFLAGSHMAHTLAHLLVVCTFFSLASLDRRCGIRQSLYGGLSLGAAVLVRPVTAAAIAVPIFLYWIALLSRSFRSYFKPAVVFCCTSAIIGTLVLFYNVATTGDAFVFGYEKLFGKQHKLGFGKNPWGKPHTPAKGVEHSNYRLRQLSRVLVYSPFPALVLPLIPFIFRRITGRDLLLACFPLSLLAIHFFYYYKEFFFPPRFLFESMFGLCLLSAEGLRLLSEKLVGSVSGRKVFMSTFLALTVFSGALFRLPADLEMFSRSYGDVEDQLAPTIERHGIQDAIVFMNNDDSDNDYYSTGFIFNGLNPLESPVIFARDCGVRNAELIFLKADKKPYRYTYYSKWDAGILEPLAYGPTSKPVVTLE